MRTDIQNMKCNYKRSWQEARNKITEKESREYDDWFNSLSKEEQEAELKRKEEDLKFAFDTLMLQHKLGIRNDYSLKDGKL